MSNRNYWLNFLRFAARNAPAGELRSFDGLEAAWVNCALPIHNATWPTSSAGDLRPAFQAAARDAVPRKLPWMAFLWEPELTCDADPLAAEVGLSVMGQLRVMIADTSSLLPPLRPLPNVELIRAKAGQPAARSVYDLNSRAYGMPDFITHSAFAANPYFNNDALEFGYIATVAGEPVATTSVMAIEGCLYVAAVATAPDHRQHGYAETVMRHALAEASHATGITHTALDASLMGMPLYQQMGYRATGETWRMFVSA